MTDEEILEKVADKVIVNGYDNKISERYEKSIFKEGIIKGRVLFKLNNFLYNTIFSHEFAKAFWGDDIQVKTSDDCQYALSHEAMGVADTFLGYAWHYHLQTMVLEENPIKYLEQFL